MGTGSKFSKSYGPGTTSTPAANSVTSAKIFDGTIATADIAAKAINKTLLAAGIGTSGIGGGDGAEITLDLNSLSAEIIDVAADKIAFMDATDNTTKLEAVADFATLMSGNATSTGIVATSGVMAMRPGSLTAADVDVTADSIIIIDAGSSNLPKKESIADLATAQAGTGLVASSGTLNTCTTGARAVGTILFGATGDCTSVTIGTTTYAYNVAPTVASGEWTYGGNAGASATNLAAAINGKTLSPYSATVNTDTVHVYANSVGTSGNVTITRTGGAQPATLENLVGGLNVATKSWCMRAYTVTANDVATAVLINIPLPFAPTKFIPRCMSSTGTLLTTITDLFTIGTVPNRIIITGAGAVHLVAGDVIHLIAQE